MMKTFKKILKFTFAFLYIFLVGFWLATGFAVRAINENHRYVETAYAKEVVVDDVTYFYRQAGLENPSTILMIHGFLGSSYDFIEVMEALKATHHVIAIDLIGFGLSEKSLTFDYAKANQAKYISKFLEILNIDSVTIIAHSMGGEVSIHLAHDYPQLVEAMILIGSAGYTVPTESDFSPPALPTFFYDYIVNNYYIQRSFFFTAYSTYEVENKLITYDAFDEMFYVNQTIPGEVMQKFTLDNDSGSTNSKLPLITQPTLLIWGTDDGFIPLSTGILMQEAMGSVASLIVMENAGHLPFDTFFTPFMNHVLEFLS
jgi:pimeloyl-ACP methyl ester carboxylesterase